MIVVVTGGRTYADAAMVASVLSGLHKTWGITCLKHGGANGADTLAAAWATIHGVPTAMFRADWAKYGRGAGPHRNGVMLASGADLVVAFPGGAGTADCVRRARGLKIHVTEISVTTSEVQP